PAGKNAKLLVEHGDVSALSIFANQLKQIGSDVVHGVIREVSLVLAGANPGAFIDSVLTHSDGSDEEAIIYSGEDELSLYHASDDSQADENGEGTKGGNDMADENKKTNDEKTVADVFNSMTEEQKTVVYALIGQALEDSEDESDDEAEHSEDYEEETTLKHNVFDREDVQEKT